MFPIDKTDFATNPNRGQTKTIDKLKGVSLGTVQENAMFVCKRDKTWNTWRKRVKNCSFFVCVHKSLA